MVRKLVIGSQRCIQQDTNLMKLSESAGCHQTSLYAWVGSEDETIIPPLLHKSLGTGLLPTQLVCLLDCFCL